MAITDLGNGQFKIAWEGEGHGETIVEIDGCGDEAGGGDDSIMESDGCSTTPATSVVVTVDGTDYPMTAFTADTVPDHLQGHAFTTDYTPYEGSTVWYAGGDDDGTGTAWQRYMWCNEFDGTTQIHHTEGAPTTTDDGSEPCDSVSITDNGGGSYTYQGFTWQT